MSVANSEQVQNNRGAVLAKLGRSRSVLRSHCLSSEATSLHLMKNFKSSTDKIVYAEMFGFHFDTDADITIECNIKVCATPSSDATCTLQTNSTCTHKDWKAKRSIREEKDNRVTVKGKLHVLQRQIGNSNSAGLLKFSLTSVVIMQFLLIFV
ncbi:uncharacterized protein LOC134699014 [Mytilus trossulus]|uniref:uncharacterized protein LOC134699014 n=1 Tax=Mytilus trossulus TaxID=6551 RepID=UPI0030064960